MPKNNYPPHNNFCCAKVMYSVVQSDKKALENMQNQHVKSTKFTFYQLSQVEPEEAKVTTIMIW